VSGGFGQLGDALQQPPLVVNRNDVFQVNFRAGHPKNLPASWCPIRA
jgi:hypothetical protein